MKIFLMKIRSVKRIVTWLYMPLLLVACTKGGDLTSSNSCVYLLSGDGDAAQLVPALAHKGTAVFSGWLDEDVRTVTATVSWKDLWETNVTDTIKSIQVWGPAGAGTNGQLLTSSALQSTNATGSYTFSLSGKNELGKKGIIGLTEGNCYYLISTSLNPGGIVRGQINAELQDTSGPASNLSKSIVFNPGNKTTLKVGDTTSIRAIVLPMYTTSKTINWSSSNPAVVSIDATGWIEARGKGLATVTATAADGTGVKADLLINVDMQLKPLDRTGWTVTVSSEKASDGGGKDAIMDGNFNSWWHSMWGPDAPLPHWLLVDMQNEKEVAFVQVYRRSANQDTKTVMLELSSDGVNFRTMGALSDFDANSSASLAFFPASTRYVRLTITASNRPPFANITELNVGAYQ